MNHLYGGSSVSSAAGTEVIHVYAFRIVERWSNIDLSTDTILGLSSGNAVDLMGWDKTYRLRASGLLSQHVQVAQ